MSELVKYEAARRALAEAVAVDEVLNVRNVAEAMRHYAHQAEDKELEIKAAQLRFRAERRLGEMLIEQKNTVGLNAGSRSQLKEKVGFGSAVTEAPKDDRPTLADVGISHKLSSKAQKIAALDATDFEQAIARHAEEVRSGLGRVAMDLLKIGAEEKGRAHRRDLAAALSEKSAELPAGRRFPAIYLDPPWRRQGGIGSRAYENHYPTMPWPEILAYLRRAADCLLPDAWAFMWIPRAHLLAPVEFERELQLPATGELVTISDKIPLAWACQLALGIQHYSTCFVWTKTDTDHPDVSGSGLIAFDQDELLLLFKRGRGLPKPAGSEKYGSNHRERATDHSRKPEHYRRMIASMVGCDSAGKPLPVLELFARVDADNPLPPGWHAAGNQAGGAICEREPGEPVVVAAGSDVGTQSAPPHALSADRLDWEALRAICAMRPVDEIVAADLLKRGLIFLTDSANPARGYTPTAAGAELGQRLHQMFWEPPSADEIRRRFFRDDDSSSVEQSAVDPNAAAPGRDTTGAVAPLFSFAAGLPSDAGETVAAAVDATDGASPAAAVTDIPAFLSAAAPAFPPTEFADLQLFIDLAKGDQVAAIAPAYLRRGLIEDWCGGWKLTGAGRVRLEVLTRERGDRDRMFAKHLSADELTEWRALAAIAGREAIDREIARDLIGKGYVDDFAADRGFLGLTESGQKWLGSIEIYVERSEGIAVASLAATPIAPKQRDIFEVLEGGDVK